MEKFLCLRCRPCAEEHFYRRNRMEQKEMQTKAPDMIKEVNGVTFIVRAYFKEDKGETMQEKIKRMLRNEAASTDFAE